MAQIHGVKGEVTPWRDFANSTDPISREPLTTQEIWNSRLSRRVKNMAFSRCCQIPLSVNFRDGASNFYGYAIIGF